MRLLACLIVAPQRGYDEPAILSYAISSFCPTSADGLHFMNNLTIPAALQQWGFRHGDTLCTLGVLIEPLGHLEPGKFRQLNVHQDQIGTVLAGEIECLDAIARADWMVASSLQQIGEELHVELFVLHDHHGLRHRRPFVKRRAISATAGLAVVSFGSVRASHIRRVAAYWVRTLVRRRYGGKGLVARPSSPLGQEMRVT